MKEDLRKPQIQTEGLEERFDAFCKEVIRNAIREVLRKEKRRQRFEITGIDFILEEDGYEDEYSFLDEEYLRGIYEAGNRILEVRDERPDEILHKLSKRKQEVFILGYGFNYSNADIAETLGISRGQSNRQKQKQSVIYGTCWRRFQNEQCELLSARKNTIIQALNGDQNAIEHILSHYESFGNYLIQANICKFACVSGPDVSRFPKEDLQQEVNYKLTKAIAGFI